MTPFEFLYFLGYSMKKRHALKNRKNLPCRVISIGNLTLGGTGKTPAVIALAEEAKKSGFLPCILTRGYKGKTRGPCFVSRGEGPLLNEYQAGDESILMAEKLQGVPIVKGGNRYEAGMFAIRHLSPYHTDIESRLLFILDDGFQHWILFRDKNILLVDGTNPFGNKRLFPLGSLREPVSAIHRADIIVLTKIASQCMGESERGDAVCRESGIESIVNEIKRYNQKAPIFFARHRPSHFVALNRDVFPLEWAEGKKFFGFCGIANPHSFRKTLLSTGIELTAFKSFGDHYRYRRGDMHTILTAAGRNDAAWIVTTEKDIMRLKGFELPENLVALAIEFSTDERFYEEVFEGIKN